MMMRRSGKLRGVEKGMSRCPSCNPLHGSKGTKECFLCKGKLVVPVEVSYRYVQSINGAGTSVISTQVPYRRKDHSA